MSTLQTVSSTLDGSLAVVEWAVIAGGLSLIVDKTFPPFNKQLYDFKSTPAIIGEIWLRILLLVIASRLAKDITARIPQPFTNLSKSSEPIPEIGGGIFAATLFFLWQSNFKDVIVYFVQNRLKF